VEHDDDVRAEAERLGVAGLLVRPIAAVGCVDECPQADALRNFDGLVAARVVRDDDLIDQIERNLPVGLFEGPGGVVGRHHDRDSLAVKQFALPPSAADEG